jgi:hypothetical protein
VAPSVAGALPRIQVFSKAERSRLALPGLYRGRVIAIEDRRSIVSGQYQAATIRDMMRRGMTELTGDAGWVDSWRRFFEPGDVVGIKVNPVGQPHVISDASVVHEIIEGLKAASQARTS